MSTPAPSVDVDQYITSLENDSVATDNYVAQQAADQAALEKKLTAFDAMHFSSPEVALMYLLNNIVAQSNPDPGGTNGSDLSIEDDNVQVLSGELNISGDGSSITNGLQQLVQNESTGTQGTADVKEYASSLDSFINILNGTTVNPSGKAYNLHISSSETQQVLQQLTTLRDQVRIGGDPLDPPAGTAAAIDLTDASTPQNFNDLYTAAQSKDQTTQANASGAINDILNAFNGISTAFGSVNKAVSAQLQFVTNIEKEVQGFLSDAFHSDFNSPTSNSVGNQKTG
jgi:hypothetical protein